MSMIVDITPDSGFLRVHVAGDFSLNEANDMIVHTFKALTRQRLQKVLVDCRQLKGNPTTIERFMHADFIAKQMERVSDTDVSRSTRFVYVGTEPLIDKQHFGETVAVNRGIIAKVTNSMEGALRWLEIDPANKTISSKKK